MQTTHRKNHAKRRYIYTAFLIISSLFLTACASMGHDVSCPVAKGMGCASLDEVNRRVSEQRSLTLAVPFVSMRSPKQNDTANTAQHLEVWIAPYADRNGTLHSAQALWAPLSTSASS